VRWSRNITNHYSGFVTYHWKMGGMPSGLAIFFLVMMCMDLQHYLGNWGYWRGIRDVDDVPPPFENMTWNHPSHLAMFTFGMILVFGCLHATMDQKNCHNVVILVQTKFEIFGDMIRKRTMVKRCSKVVHILIYHYVKLNVNRNDVVVLWSTYITCSCLSHNHCFYKRIKKYLF
jgi:hypothetical protein